MKKIFFFDINVLGVRKLGKWAKNTNKSVLGWGVHAEMSVLPPSSGSAAPNFQKFAVTFDSDIAET